MCVTPLDILIFLIVKSLCFEYKNKLDTSQVQNLKNDVSDFFICDFWQNEFYKAFIKPCKSQKALKIKELLAIRMIFGGADLKI